MRMGVLGALTGAAFVLLLCAAIGLFTVYSGAYNIAATEEHTSFVRWAFDTTFHNSIENHAADLVAPEVFPSAMVERGATLYKEMCQHCHAGPGVERAEWARGMRPRPPHLTEAAAKWEAAEIFWLVTHGAKMTGMPAFGPTHSDEEIWSIAAFVERLPAMTPEEYSTLGGAGHHGGTQGDPGH